MLIPIDEVGHFDVTTHDPATGAAIDADSAPTFDVFEEATDTPILDDQTMTKRTSLTGNYRGTFTASAANGFEAGKWYSVVVSATVDSIAAKHVAMHFRVGPAESVAGVPKVDTSHISGTAQTANDVGADVNDILADTADIQPKIGSPAVTLAADIADVESKVDDLETRLGTPSDLGSGATVAANLVDIEGQTDDIASKASQASVDTIDGIVDAILVDTAEIGVAGAGLTEAGGDGDHLTAINLPDQTMNITGNITGNLSGSVGSVTGAVGSVTGSVGGNVTGSVGSLAAQAKADVNAEVDTALVDIHLDHLLAADYDPQSKPGAAGALLNEMVESDNASPGRARFTAGALEEAPTGGSAPTADEIADAVWEEAIADHSGTAGSTAEQLQAAGSAGDPWATALPGSYTSGQAGKIVGDNVNATISSRATQASVDTIDGIVDAILVDTAEIGAAGAGLTAINLPDQTMNIVGNVTGNLSGSVGSVTGNVGGNVAGSVGSVTGNVGGNVTGSIGSLATQAKADVNAEADAALADVGVTSTVTGRIDAAVSTRASQTSVDDVPTNAELATALAAADDAVLAAIAALNNLSAAQVNAEVVDALATDTYAEPAAVPAATASLKDKINFLAALARNKVTQTATTQTLRNDADSGNIGQAAVSDDTVTFTRSEWA